MNLQTQTTIAIMLSGDKKKLRKAARLIAAQEKHRRLFLKAREELKALTGLT